MAVRTLADYPAELVKQMRMVLALPPYDSPANYAANDNYFWHSIKATYGERAALDVEALLREEHKQ